MTSVLTHKQMVRCTVSELTLRELLHLPHNGPPVSVTVTTTMQTPRRDDSTAVCRDVFDHL